MLVGNKSEEFDGAIVKISPETEQVSENDGEVQEILAKGELENGEKGLTVYVSVLLIRLVIVRVKLEDVL